MSDDKQTGAVLGDVVFFLELLAIFFWCSIDGIRQWSKQLARLQEKRVPYDGMLLWNR